MLAPALPWAAGAGEVADGEAGWWDWAKEGASDQLLHEVHTTGALLAVPLPALQLACHQVPCQAVLATGWHALYHVPCRMHLRLA